MKNKKRKKAKYTFNKIITIISVLLIPFFVALKIVEDNHNEVFTKNFLIVKELVLYALIFVFIVNLLVLIKNKCIKSNRKVFVTAGAFLLAITFCLTGTIKLVYYNEDFKEWLISTSVGSINYRYVAANVYNTDTIEEVVDKNVKEENIDYVKDIVNYDDLTVTKVHYRNEEEEAVLARENNEDYKIVKIEGTTIGADYHYEGYMAVIYDPSRVTLAKSSGAGMDEETSYGETLATISRRSGAKVAINGGGFYDPFWSSNGGIPHGPTIINGVLETEFARGIESGGLIGFNKENKLVLRRMNGQEALDAGIRDAVDWGPYLIVDGYNYFKNTTWYTWTCARTAIGQRADGIVLFLVIDGLQEHSKGASYADIAAIMEKYGAVNASSLDGGTSTSMTVDHKYINSPFNGERITYRYFPNAWIFK